jgi:hypothetical protein
MLSDTQSIGSTNRRFRRTGWLLALGLLVHANAAQAFVIDSFETDQATSVFAPVGSASNWASGPGILGSERDVTLTLASGVGTTAIASAGEFAYGHIASSEGSATLTWDGSDASSSLDAIGLGGVDLTDAGASDGFVMSLLFNDFAASMVLTVYTDAANFSQATAPLPGGVPPDPQALLKVLFDDFVVAGGTGADFTDVGALSLEIDGSSTPALDVSLDYIETSHVSVPEPSTAVSLLSALAAIAWSRRRPRLLRAR